MLRGLLFALVIFWVVPLQADELRPAYLQLTETTQDAIDVYWKVPARGGNQRLSLDVLFGDGARQLSMPTDGYLNDVNVRQWQISHPGGLTGLTIEIDGLFRTSSEVLGRFEYLDGSSTTHRFTPDATDFRIAGQPTWWDTVLTYLVLGIEHILFGLDHLLFVLVLLLLVRDTRKLIFTITAFTLSHSITLILAALGIIHVPVPPVEACIALSIVFVTTEIIHGLQGRPGLTARRPWIVAFSFGLLHGLGFAAALGEIGLPQNAILTALVVFNIGVEVGQLLFIFAVLASWKLLSTFVPRLPEWSMHIPAYLIGSLASVWVFERVYAFWP